MKSETTRRDFLKLAGALPLGFAASRALQKFGIPDQLSNEGQNFLVIVFDAFSAQHITTHGYQRETTPHLARLSEQAIVYHNHYASGNFTTSGTASLLTGTLPWTHRALQNKGTIADPVIPHNIFNPFKDHYRIAYTHNPWAHILLEQLDGDIEELIPRLSLFVESYDEFVQKIFRNDDDIASVSWSRNTGINKDGYSYSLFLSHIYASLRERKLANLLKEYPRGIPSIGLRVESHYLLDQAIDWIGNRLTKIPQPFLGYFHFLPPHGPYFPSIEFIDRFARDNFQPLKKANEFFSEGKTYDELLKFRTQYDEFILYTDDQFNIFYERLRNSGLLENTWIILTSDHGEMFERGILGHSTDAMYQPVLRVPLMIFEPGRTKGENIHAPTSAIDVLPTLLSLAGKDIPDWAEGKVLPPFAGPRSDTNRSVYAVRALRTGRNDPITRSSTVLVKGGYKLHYYRGYTDLNLPAEIIRLFDVESDPEEMVDLADTHTGIASELLDELKRNLDDANKPYL